MDSRAKVYTTYVLYSKHTLLQSLHGKSKVILFAHYISSYNIKSQYTRSHYIRSYCISRSTSGRITSCHITSDHITLATIHLTSGHITLGSIKSSIILSGRSTSSHFFRLICRVYLPLRHLLFPFHSYLTCNPKS